MAIEFIPTRIDHARNPALEIIIDRLRDDALSIILGDGILYYGWPKYTDYDAVRHFVDLALVCKHKGVIFIRVLPAANANNVAVATETLSQVSAGAVAQLVKSARLRGRNRQLKIPVLPILYTPGVGGLHAEDIDTFDSEVALLRHIAELPDQALTDDEISETRSIFEGAKSLSRPSKRVFDPATQVFAASLSALEDQIASFDARQRRVALTAVAGPQRIRGLAGSGKTVILAMRAALAHLDDPSARILVTYYTRSLRDHLKRLITRFYRHFGEGDPDWSKIDVYHAWGRKDLPGVHREAALRADVTPMAYSEAVAGAAKGQQPFDFACRSLADSGRVKPYYDLILIDEGQDVPGAFYELCFHLAKGSRDEKQIVWAYDELQNVFDVNVRTPTELFGRDVDGQPRIDLPRSLPAHAETNDFVLPKCYRNQRNTLVLAHAIGFGIYGNQVQMLQNREHWEDVGYEIERGELKPGNDVIICRPERNSPAQLVTPPNVPLTSVHAFANITDEVNFCADEFKRFIDGGLHPEDLMAIAIDDRAAKTYLSLLSEALALRDISSNNIIADIYSEPAFLIEGKTTLSTVYRAKGNEAAVVAVLGCDAVSLSSRNGRNKLFTAFTRSKGWLRITGMGPKFEPLHREIDRALQLAPEMRFTMGDPKQIDLIQRDLSEKDARLQRAQAAMEKMKEEFGLTDDDLRALMAEAPPNDPR
jgi:superfamily I DNA and RNA helicase